MYDICLDDAYSFVYLFIKKKKKRKKLFEEKRRRFILSDTNFVCIIIDIEKSFENEFRTINIT